MFEHDHGAEDGGHYGGRFGRPRAPMTGNHHFDKATAMRTTPMWMRLTPRTTTMSARDNGRGRRRRR